MWRDVHELDRCVRRGSCCRVDRVQVMNKRAPWQRRGRTSPDLAGVYAELSANFEEDARLACDVAEGDEDGCVGLCGVGRRRGVSSEGGADGDERSAGERGGKRKEWGKGGGMREDARGGHGLRRSCRALHTRPQLRRTFNFSSGAVVAAWQQPATALNPTPARFSIQWGT